ITTITCCRLRILRLRDCLEVNESSLCKTGIYNFKHFNIFYIRNYTIFEHSDSPRKSKYKYVFRFFEESTDTNSHHDSTDIFCYSRWENIFDYIFRMYNLKVLAFLLLVKAKEEACYEYNGVCNTNVPRRPTNDNETNSAESVYCGMKSRSRVPYVVNDDCRPFP
ncbi:hypothetical protein L9F63_012380, partial [Diploptera punctata]